MPGNIVSINDSIEYYVGDSKMEKVIECLKTNGVKQKKKRR